MEGPSLTGEESAFLVRVRDGDVSWHRRSVRLWESEDVYVLATKLGQSLRRRGLVAFDMAAGYRHVQRGPVVLTSAGRRALGEVG